MNHSSLLILGAADLIGAPLRVIHQVI